MFHLIVGFGGPDRQKQSITVWGSRFLSSTDQETHDNFVTLDSDSISLIKQYPAVIMEEGSDADGIIAVITSVSKPDRDLLVEYTAIEGLEKIDGRVIQKYALELGIENYEFETSHWAIKNTDLLFVLHSNEVINSDQLNTAQLTINPNPEPENKPIANGNRFNLEQIFIVHGQDENAKNSALIIVSATYSVKTINQGSEIL